MPQNRTTLATAQYPIGYFTHWDDYACKVTQWVASACDQGAQWLLFPEYGAMELASLLPEDERGLQAQLTGLQPWLPAFLDLYCQLAQRHSIYVQAGTFPVWLGDHFVNRAFLFHPDGHYDSQDKRQMTRFEREQWGIEAGKQIHVFDTDIGKVGINVCYDSEFPLIARYQVEQGARLILAPSCTDTLAGYHRVRIGCQARALENQCCVVQACTVGEATWSEAVDMNIGRAAIYTPVDTGFPADGILAIGEMNQPQWVIGSVDFTQVMAIRAEGQVFNYRDWPTQLPMDTPF